MTWIDILRSSLGNLFRRKLRTTLTLLGVAIGITAIVVLVSLGIAAEDAMIKQLSQYDDITKVDVFGNYGGVVIRDPDSQENQGPLLDKITEETIKQIEALPHVTMASPIYNFYAPDGNLKLTQGRYEVYITLIGVSPKYLAAMGYVPEYGEFFAGNSPNLQMVLTPTTMLDMRDPRKKDMEWIDYTQYLQTGEPLPYPELDWASGRFTLQVESYEYDQNGNPKTKQNKIKNAGVIGTIKATKEMMMNMPYGVYVDMRALLYMMNKDKKTYKSALEQLEKNGFDQITVKVDSFDNVEKVLADLKEMGLVNTNSPMQWIESSRDSIRSVQLLLGGISAISLIVAALGIANTMMMSIYERTREIGVMKVLGCRMGNIRSMFVMEAAFIGLFGGLIGLLLSYGFSYAMNEIPAVSELVGKFISLEGREGLDVYVSLIPWWLSLGAWGFGVLIAVLSGLYPSQRAMWLSPLAAIRNE